MLIKFFSNISINVANSSNGATISQKKWLGAMILATVTCVMISIAVIAFPGIQANFIQEFCDFCVDQSGMFLKNRVKAVFILAVWMPIAFFWAALVGSQKDKIVVGKRSALLGVVFAVWFFFLIFGSIYIAIGLEKPFAALIFQVLSFIVLSLNKTQKIIRKHIDD